jgi:hypothetical protein
MSLPVCPSAFIRFAVAMCSESSTLRAARTGAVLPGSLPLEGVALPDQLALILGDGLRPPFCRC